jgi:GDPmannose 4,6-dehydratase
MNKNRAFLTGILGQDGSYLAELLLSKGYEVAGLVRRNSNPNINSRIAHIADKLKLYQGDMLDKNSLYVAIQDFQPTEVYNLAAQSFVGESWTSPFYTAEVNALGVLNILTVIKETNKNIKFYQASTSELFGKVTNNFQDESTPFHPRSPYGISKLFAHWTTTNYRESYDMFACNGILFNHDSPRRGLEFVTKKITNHIIGFGEDKVLKLGNINSKRDFGYAKEYVNAMYLMLQQEKPDDFVIATGKTHSIKEFIIQAYKYIDIPIIFDGEGLNEKGINPTNGKILVEIDEKFYRPAEVDLLCGNASKAKEVLKWEAKVKFEELIQIMMKGGE